VPRGNFFTFEIFSPVLFGRLRLLNPEFDGSINDETSEGENIFQVRKLEQQPNSRQSHFSFSFFNSLPLPPLPHPLQHAVVRILDVPQGVA